MKKQLRFAQIKAFYSSISDVNKNEITQTHTDISGSKASESEFDGIFRRRKLGNSLSLFDGENPFRFDGSLNICCFVLCQNKYP
jgi:hypothetical protein